MTETEKITINMGAVDLGRIDLLVDEGFYGNRTDFIRTAIRNQLDRHAETVTSAATRRDMVIGSLVYNRKDLEQLRAKKQKLNVKVIGFFIIAQDVTAELALATIESVVVHGAFKAPDDVKAALKERVR